MCVAMPGRNQRRQRSLLDNEATCTAGSTGAAVEGAESDVVAEAGLTASMSSVDALHDERHHVMTFVEPPSSSSSLNLRNSTSHARETNF